MKAPPPLRHSIKRQGMSILPVSGKSLPPPPSHHQRPRLFSQHRDPEDMAPSIIMHHQLMSIVGPEQPSTVQHSSAPIDLDHHDWPWPGRYCEAAPRPLRGRGRHHKRSHRSTRVLKCAHAVVRWLSRRRASCHRSWRNWRTTSSHHPLHHSQAGPRIPLPRLLKPRTLVPSTTETEPDTDSGAEGHRGQKRAVATSDTSYSQDHRITCTGPSNYPKKPNRPRTLTSSEEDQPPPRPRRHRLQGSDYLREHRATTEDRHPYPKRHLWGRLRTHFGMSLC